jgi:hypothetical protein
MKQRRVLSGILSPIPVYYPPSLDVIEKSVGVRWLLGYPISVSEDRRREECGLEIREEPQHFCLKDVPKNQKTVFMLSVMIRFEPGITPRKFSLYCLLSALLM